MYTAISNKNKFQFGNARSKLRNFTLEMHAVFDGIPQCRVEGGGCRRGCRRGGPRRGGAPAHLRAPRRPVSVGCLSHVTPPASGGGGCYGYRVTPPTSGGCSRPPRAPPSSVDSPYVRAKQAQDILGQKLYKKRWDWHRFGVKLFLLISILLSFCFLELCNLNVFPVIEKDPNKAVPLFWAAINSGDRIESALKDMATKCDRTKEQIEMLTLKLIFVDEELASGRWKTKLSKSHGRVVYLSLRDEKAWLLGNLAWAHMQSENYDGAEMLYSIYVI
uniref:Uncharacterized protein n=2 Tax=Oryza sativa subsp. japonica TaxID=39947 RepID=Q10H21_ORYSJ|nr:hypothetical protein [Oryza sativa Japonica Group]ABF97525.1 hypothetical protein LOC_Os03g40840 [Oryza sativa Japonica Group]